MWKPLKILAFTTLFLLTSTVPSMILEKSSARYARKLAQNSMFGSECPLNKPPNNNNDQITQERKNNNIYFHSYFLCFYLDDVQVWYWRQKYLQITVYPYAVKITKYNHFSFKMGDHPSPQKGGGGSLGYEILHGPLTHKNIRKSGTPCTMLYLAGQRGGFSKIKLFANLITTHSLLNPLSISPDKKTITLYDFNGFIMQIKFRLQLKHLLTVLLKNLGCCQ